MLVARGPAAGARRERVHRLARAYGRRYGCGRRTDDNSCGRRQGRGPAAAAAQIEKTEMFRGRTDGFFFSLTNRIRENCLQHAPPDRVRHL